MIIIGRKDGENIDRFVKRYKRKHRDVKQMKEQRSRKHFVKKSELRRIEKRNTIYRLAKFSDTTP